jgi:16S rRNA (guanine527-N7)-methyltransferase
MFLVERDGLEGAFMAGETADTSLEKGLQAYAEMLRASPHNLLSRTALAELETRHFPESLAFAEALPPSIRLLDVGTGGGLPGMVIAIARPDVEVHLMDATGKKVRFLEEAVAGLGLTVTVHQGRAEELSRTALRRSFDVVTARAVAPLDRLAGWCAPYLRPGGQVRAIKGEQWAAELEAAAGAIRMAGLRVGATPDVGPREAGDHRPLVVVLEKIG